MKPILLRPNLDHKVTIPRAPLQCITITSFEPNEGDIILDGLRPLKELRLNISMTSTSGTNLLKIMNWGQTTITLVEINRATSNHIPVLTEIRPGGSIDLQPYVDFTCRFFTFIAYSYHHSDFRIVKLGINTTTNDRTLFLDYKIV